MSDLKVYRVDDGGESVWCITDDPEKARAISREYLRGDGLDEEDYSDQEEIRELPMDEKITIRDDDGPAAEEPRTMTCEGWIAECGEGFLATTCW